MGDRDILISSLKEWSETSEDIPFISIGLGENVTPKEVFAEIDKRTDTGEGMLRVFERSVKDNGLEKTVARILRKNQKEVSKNAENK